MIVLTFKGEFSVERIELRTLWLNVPLEQVYLIECYYTHLVPLGRNNLLTNVVVLLGTQTLQPFSPLWY